MMTGIRGAWILFAVLCLNACCSSTNGFGLAGRVVDPGDKPVAGVEVRVAKRLVSRTDRVGRFTLRGVAAAQCIAVSFAVGPKARPASTARLHDASEVLFDLNSARGSRPPARTAESATFDFGLLLPSGRYIFEFDWMADFVEWFG